MAVLLLGNLLAGSLEFVRAVDSSPHCWLIVVEVQVMKDGEPGPVHSGGVVVRSRLPPLLREAALSFVRLPPLLHEATPPPEASYHIGSTQVGRVGDASYRTAIALLSDPRSG